MNGGQGVKAKSDQPGLKALIAEQARKLGFDTVAFTTAEGEAAWRNGLEGYLADGCHGAMEWMETTFERRVSPQALWRDARSVIVLGVNYGPGFDPAGLLGRPERGNVSVYARGDDYHDVVKKRLKQLARWLVEREGCEVKVFVDTAPVMEKPVAARAGMGWQGKHTNLVSREYGSWLLLGEVFTTLEIEPDAAERDHCGTCQACLDSCPTNAFPAPYRLDARRCISYLTIEHKGHIPAEFRTAIGNRIYGCDDCLAACPWNKFAQTASEAKFLPRIFLTAPRLDDLSRLDDQTFRAAFSRSPIKRIGRDRFIRNVLIAIGNSGRADLAERAEALVGDPSPLVRAMAVWALSRLLDREAFNARRRRHEAGEDDAAVLAEWQAGGGDAADTGREEPAR